MAKSKKKLLRQLEELRRQWAELPRLPQWDQEAFEASLRIPPIDSRPTDKILLRLLAEKNERATSKKHGGRVVTAAEADLNKLYPHGVPDGVSTKQAENELRAAREKQGRKGYSYETVRRALGRRK